MNGPTQPYSIKVMKSNHRLENEGFEEGVNRISEALSDSARHYHAIREIGMDRRFLFGGRIQASAGSSKTTTMHNCFVSGTIEDSYVHGDGNIMQRLTEAAATMRLGGGIGYSFSTLRPRNSLIHKLQSSSCGPVTFMDLYNANGLCVQSAGDRRGAQMGVMRVDHPDIEEFIHAKQTPGRLTGFNVSVAITDEFMHCVEADSEFTLRFGGRAHGTINARNLWQQIMRGTWDWAEPGVLFIDRINEYNNLWYCEDIVATNPCGEQPLPPFGACLLGSFLMPQYLLSASTGGVTIDLGQLATDVGHVVRSMDMVNDLSNYPLPQQRAEALSKRRMGIGVTGLANAVEACGYPYGSPGFLKIEDSIMQTIAVSAYKASALLADEKGAFPMYDERLLESKFMVSMPEDVRDMVSELGLRNSHLTSIAPTGSISFGLGDNCSSSIEPVFALRQERDVIGPDGKKELDITDWGYRELGTEGRTTRDVTIEEHLLVQATAQRWVDSAVSKTVNVGDEATWEEFCNLYTRAWQLGAKGLTTHRAAGQRRGVLRDADDKAAETCEIMPDGSRSCE